MTINVQHQESSNELIRVNFDGKEQSIFYHLYTPESQSVKATLVILHGMQEHSGRYDSIARFFADRGYAVLTYDHTGHGKTAKSGEERGYFQRKKPADQLVADAKLMADYLNKDYPDIPHFILGHSMGSFITRAYLQEYSDEMQAAVIVGTGGKVPGICFAKAYFAILNTFAPKKRSQFVQKTFGKMNNKKFKGEEDFDETSWLSLSKTNRQNFKDDPLTGNPFSNNGFYTLISINKRATKPNWAKNINKDFPMLFVSGADDPIGDFGKGVLKTTAHLEKKGFSKVTTQLYPEMRHEILNEDIKEEVFLDIYHWLEAQIPTKE